MAVILWIKALYGCRHIWVPGEDKNSIRELKMQYRWIKIKKLSTGMKGTEQAVRLVEATVLFIH
jgi:hypothetical protein